MKAILKTDHHGGPRTELLVQKSDGSMLDLIKLLDIMRIDLTITSWEPHQVTLTLDKAYIQAAVEQMEIDVDNLIKQLADCIGANRMMESLRKVM